MREKREKAIEFHADGRGTARICRNAASIPARIEGTVRSDTAAGGRTIPVRRAEIAGGCEIDGGGLPGWTVGTPASFRVDNERLSIWKNTNAVRTKTVDFTEFKGYLCALIANTKKRDCRPTWRPGKG